MESKIEALGLQNQDLKGEVSQLKKQMAQMFQILSQTNVAITVMANHGAAGHAQASNTPGPPPYAVRDPSYQRGIGTIEGRGPASGLVDYSTPRGSQTNTSDRGQVASLEERFSAMEKENQFGLEAVDLCLVSNVDLLADFKTLEFDKYKGSSCPRVHLAMYCRKMAAYKYDDKILVHCFQDSLTGASLNWYISLERGRVKTWRDLAEAFLKQYKYNEDMALDCSRLQNMAKREQEGFKEYVQRWCELAAQVQPPITERNGHHVH
ncbi:hypothetical protein CR513_40528, partial [Mucuna pruriens]